MKNMMRKIKKLSIKSIAALLAAMIVAGLMPTHTAFMENTEETPQKISSDPHHVSEAVAPFGAGAPAEYFLASFFDWDDAVVPIYETSVEKGEIAAYMGPAIARPGYTFAGDRED